jgi:plasmid stability protein
MKNVTLSMDDDLLKAARAYAARHESTLNRLVRDLLSRTVETDPEAAVRELRRVWETHPVDTSKWKWNREEAHERGR